MLYKSTGTWICLPSTGVKLHAVLGVCKHSLEWRRRVPELSDHEPQPIYEPWVQLETLIQNVRWWTVKTSAAHLWHLHTRNIHKHTHKAKNENSAQCLRNVYVKWPFTWHGLWNFLNSFWFLSHDGLISDYSNLYKAPVITLKFILVYI